MSNLFVGGCAGWGKVTLYSLLPKIQNIVNPRDDLVKMEGEGGRNKKLVPPTPMKYVKVLICN